MPSVAEVVDAVVGGDTHSQVHQLEMATPAGVRINLVFNGTARADARNVLQDEPVKWPGVTHVAFVVDELDALVDWLETAGIAITEGPGPIGPRRVGLFIRDPDGNVLEFNQLL